ncbi:hypothetical protein [Lacrimispora celerecrescens]|uniref:Uncharacterized protein n=1 Tax=Lacrimispora celerecrescens TaxID=29354 RepID=A0A084JJ89_9FIRM|nr:hypothetical protein [Lacrimispora celerecrescens]KEZ89023.1 hypothetical protein IO98_17415 [Lacrimispora celerecrescens]
MKKIDMGYFLKILGLRLMLLAAILIAPVCILLWELPQMDSLIATFLTFEFLYIFFWLPNKILDSNLTKHSSLHEQALKEQGFVIDYCFSADNGVFFLDAVNGKFAVVFKYNPKELQFIDGATLDDICTHNGEQINNGTRLVSCRFTINGQKQKIDTLRVTGGRQIHMKDLTVLEAISKADMLCERLTEIKSKATLQKG